MTKAELLTLLEPYDDDDVVALWEWFGEVGTSHTYEIEGTVQSHHPDTPTNILKTGFHKGKRCIRLMKNHYVPKID